MLCRRSATTSSDPLELESDDDGEDHAKHGLKHGVVGRIERARSNALKDLER
jgi:hypothetical protein